MLEEYVKSTDNDLDDAIFAIKEMQVRGAPLIGVTASFGMYLASKKSSEIDFLIRSIPTAISKSSGKSCYNLDFYTMTHSEIRNLYKLVT